MEHRRARSPSATPTRRCPPPVPPGWCSAAGGSITSPKLCADLLRPTLRFGAYAYRGTGTLRVEAVDDKGAAVVLGRLAGAEFAAGAATGHVAFGTVLGLVPDSFKHVRLRITAESGTWVADAVYIDPYHAVRRERELATTPGRLRRASPCR